MIVQAMSLIGAFMVLGAYFALQRRWLSGDDRLFSLLNFVGAGMLTWVAVEDRRIGFILLEGAWALLSLPGAIRGKWAGEGARPRRSPSLIPPPVSLLSWRGLAFYRRGCKLGLAGVTPHAGPPVKSKGGPHCARGRQPNSREAALCRVMPPKQPGHRNN